MVMFLVILQQALKCLFYHDLSHALKSPLFYIFTGQEKTCESGWLLGVPCTTVYWNADFTEPSECHAVFDYLNNKLSRHLTDD